MNFKQYVTSLIDLNYDKIQSRHHSEYYASINIGLVEELLELGEAEGVEANVKEAGDVIAYTTLIIVSNQLSNGLHLYSHDIMDSLVTEASDTLSYTFGNTPSAEYPSHLALQVASTAKRYFREGEVITDVFVANVAAMAYEHARLTLEHRYLPEMLTVEQVLSTNIEKLRKRRQDGLLFKGRGDNR